MTVKDEDRGDVIDEKAEETTPETKEEEGTSEATSEEGDSTESGAEEPGGADGADEESAGEGESTEEKDGDKSPSEYMIPKSRYDTASKRNKALQAKIERMESERAERIEATRTAEPSAETGAGAGAEKPSPQSRITELDDLITDALLDGDKDAAGKLRTEQRDLERASLRDELSQTSATAASQAREQVALDATVDFLETTYEELNPQNKAFDQKAVEELELLRHAFQSTGEYTGAQALLKAAKYKFPDLPQLDEAPATKSDKEKVKKAIDAANKQPADISGVGDDAGSGGVQEEIDPSKLTQSDMETLPEATFKRLRGDTL